MKSIKISKIEKINNPSPRFDLEVEDNHNYFANGVLAHNCCCVITAKRAHSRKGEDFHCINHIKDALKEVFEKVPNLVLHGELFNPKYKNLLNRMAALVSVNRQEKDVTPEDEEESRKIVKFFVYDGFGGETTKDSKYTERKAYLKKILAGIPYIEVTEYQIAQNREEVEVIFRKTTENKEEGVMIKILDAPYEQKRSKNILKLKNFISKEFQILGFVEGKGNWAGCVKKVTCKLNVPATNGKTEFESNIRGTVEELTKLWLEREKHVNKWATVELTEFSEFGIPLIPYTDAVFREDYEGK